jgi:hypothetical protein
MAFGNLSGAAAALLTAVALCATSAGARAEGAGDAGALLRIEARFVDPATGLEAGWGATGQILIPPQPADPVLQRWQQARSVATSPARQAVTLAPGERGLIRVGREIPFAGWFLRYGTRCGLLDQDTGWREVESALEIEVGAPAADGSVRLALTPEFTYLSGRSRGTVSFAAERTEAVLVPGAEARLAISGERAAFYRRLLAGYDPLRRVWPVELVLRADPVEAPGAPAVPAP